MTRGREGRAPRWTLGLALAVAALPCGQAAGQTGVEGVSPTRPDQNAAAAKRRGTPPVEAPKARDPNAAIVPFRLTKVIVEGSTLPQPSLAEAYAPFIGRMIDNQGLSDITQKLADAYAGSDVALYTVLVPEQRFATGSLRLIAVEGYVAGVEIRGKLRRNRIKLLQAYLRRLEQERPLHSSTLQRVVSLIRDMPGLYPSLSFDRGDAQGAVRLVVQATKKPVQVSVGINDRGTALLGRTQVQADAYVNGILGGADQLHLTAVAPAHISRFQYYAGAYATPLDADGTTLTGTLSYLRTRPASFPLKGDATSFGVQVSRPLIRSYDKNLYATVGVDGTDANNALLGLRISNDRVRTLRTALSYATSGTRNEFALSGTASFGLDVLGARLVPGQSDKHFIKLNAKIGDNRQFGKSFVLRLAGFAQATRNDLPSSEQIALGGDEFGRAYEAAIISGDYGYAGSAELAWRPDKGLPKLLAGSELYAFTDAGRVRYRSRLGAASTASHLASVGVGTRIEISAKAIVQLEAVRGLDNPVPYEDRKETRLLFSVRSLL